MYAIHRQVHPPTGIEHAVYCQFLPNQSQNLVVAGNSQLHVFRLLCDSEISSKGDKITDARQRRDKLELQASFSVFGNIASMESVRLVNNTRDSLLLSFMDAKLSVVEYDPATHDLKTLSLHYFEEPELKDGFQENLHLPRVRVDPDGRCAVMLIYGTRLVVLPFKRDSISDDTEPVPSEGQKSGLLPTYIIDMREMDEKLLNVVDMRFLHGYYEPTLLILFEPNQTWPGRVAVRQDTCSIVAISLNIAQKVHPVIWSLSSLPFDCTQALAVPKPVGGVVIFAVNSLLYLNQSVPPYGTSLNSITQGSTAFPLRVQEGLKMTLDCAQAAFIAYDKIVISLKGGEIYVLTLITDGMRSVRSFNFDKAAASVLTTCMTNLEPGYLFLGSRLGNSLLLKYTEKLHEAPSDSTRDRQEEPQSKKKRPDLGLGSDWAPKDVMFIDDLDEIEVYGSELQSGTQLASYSFEVCDSILNIGPCANVAMGEPAFLSEEFQNSTDPDLELVCCSGYGKNGALSVLQEQIDEKPETPKEEREEENTMEGDSKKHGFLILSRTDSTMILQTGQEIMELDHSGFNTQGPTVYAGNLGGNRYILQVSPMGVRLMQGTRQVHHIPLDLGAPVVHCSVADPYAIILSSEGHMMQLQLREESGTSSAWLSVTKQPLHSMARIQTLCVYRDLSGLFCTESPSQGRARDEPSRESQTDEELLMTEPSTVDDEEELLYGDSCPVFGQFKKEEVACSTSNQSPDIPSTSPSQPTHWCLLVRENGNMEIYRLPDWRLIFMAKNFPAGQRVLMDSSSGLEIKKDECGRQVEILKVHEIMLVGLGHKKSRPFLLANVEQELLIYEAFPYDSTPAHNNLRVRFKKIQHNVLLREKRSRFGVRKVPMPAEEPSGRGNVCHFRYFDDIAGYAGVFICGPCPYWLFMTSRGALRTHPMTIDGPVDSFAPFHNINCPKGFLYFNKQVCAFKDGKGKAKKEFCLRYVTSHMGYLVFGEV
uniref:Cleavage and polyadenylation specificity factor subunit 1 n=1 Tax=Eptatretus burgeri TaxID=7764 RepID=A0A8C4Q1K6_EPTBU